MNFLQRLRPNGRRPMTCAEVAELVQHFLDDELDPRRARRLAAHLDDCQRCGLEAATYRRIKATFAERSPLASDSLTRLTEFAERLASGGHSHRPEPG